MQTPLGGGPDRAGDAERGALARRLYDLRQSHWPGVTVLQPHLAAALKMSVSTVSNWEKVDDRRVPKPAQLHSIATFYASPRGFAGTKSRILGEAELTESERSERDRLYSELSSLRTQEDVGGSRPSERSVSSQTDSFDPWIFSDSGIVRIVCGAIKEEERPKFASPSDHNYMRMSAYADLDSLYELLRYLPTRNPGLDVSAALADGLRSNELRGNLIVLGNLAWVQESSFAVPDIPIRQIVDEEKARDGEVFEVRDDDGSWRRIEGPRLVGNNIEGAVIEDVGMFVRTPSPINPDRTLTLCSGIFTRGGYGAVRMLTDPALGSANLDYLADRFRNATSYGVLTRVFVNNREVVTPRLRIERDGQPNTIFEFPTGLRP